MAELQETNPCLDGPRGHERQKITVASIADVQCLVGSRPGRIKPATVPISLFWWALAILWIGLQHTCSNVCEYIIMHAYDSLTIRKPPTPIHLKQVSNLHHVPMPFSSPTPHTVQRQTYITKLASLLSLRKGQ